MFHRFIKRPGMATALLAISGLTAQGAQASAVSATAELWGMTQSGMAALTFSNDFFVQDAQTSLSGDTFQTGTTAQDIVLNASVGGNTTFAESTWSTFSLPHANAGLTNKGQASSMFQWSFDWVATGTGTVSVDFDYNINTTILNYQAGESAGVSSWVDALLDGTSNEQQAFHYFVNQNGQSDGEGHLVLSFDVVDGQKGSITFTAAGQAYASPVPVPAAGWLLGSSILGLLGYARRRHAARA